MINNNEEKKNEIMSCIYEAAQAKAEADIAGLFDSENYQEIANNMFSIMEDFRYKYPKEYAFCYPENEKGINNDNMNNKYLEITIHDNDFRFSLEFVAEIIVKILNWDEFKHPITSENLDKLSVAVQHMFYGTSEFQHVLDIYPNANFEYFKPQLRIVDYSEIEDWENGECVYIPLFESDEYLVR